MIIRTWATAALAAGVYAGGMADLILDRRLAGQSLRSNNHHLVVKRQMSSSVVVNSDGSLNMTQWDAIAHAACMKQLQSVTEATNPSGTCTCYNIPALNNATGAFEADLRLYQVSTPRDDFAGISPANIQVGLSYNGASVSAVGAQQAANSAKFQVSTRDNTNVTLLHTYLFVGQIDKAQLLDVTSQGALEQVVTPMVTLSAKNQAGATVSTNVSTNEAAFVAGVFAESVVLSDAAKAQNAVNLIQAELANGTVAFVMPGVNLLVFPIGLFITGSWFLIGLGFIGFGFYERVQYRESYRRRTESQKKSMNAGTI